MTVRRPIALVAWLAVLASAVTALLAVDRPTTVDPSVAAVVNGFWLIRQAAILVGIYLLVTTVLGALARVCRLATLTALLDRITVRSVRRLLVVATAMSIAGPGVASAGTTANEPPPVLVHVPQRTANPTAQPPPVLHRLDKTPEAPAPAAANPNAKTASVAAGGNLWTLAETTLRSAWGRQPRTAEIVPYWKTLIELNRSRLAHADDPDLVYAGQTFALPPVPPAG